MSIRDLELPYIIHQCFQVAASVITIHCILELPFQFWVNKFIKGYRDRVRFLIFKLCEKSTSIIFIYDGGMDNIFRLSPLLNIISKNCVDFVKLLVITVTIFYIYQFNIYFQATECYGGVATTLLQQSDSAVIFWNCAITCSVQFRRSLCYSQYAGFYIHVAHWYINSV